MSSRVSDAFGDFDGRTWLNTAHQGALPSRAGDEAIEAIRWRLAAHVLTAERFRGVPACPRNAVGRLLNVPIRPATYIVEPDELAASVTARTRLLCTTWTRSFSGQTVDLEAAGVVLRNGALGVSPYLHDEPADIDRALEVLDAFCDSR